MEANLTTVAALSGGLAVIWFRGFFSVLLLLLLYSMFAGMILLPAVYAVLANRKEKKLDRPAYVDKIFGKMQKSEDMESDGPGDDEGFDAEDIDEDVDQDVEWELGD